MASFHGRRSSDAEEAEAEDEEAEVAEAEAIDSHPDLLELASQNDLQGFKQALLKLGHGKNMEAAASMCLGFGLWYCRRPGTPFMAWEQRNAVMIASLYGSLDVLTYTLSLLSRHDPGPKGISEGHGHGHGRRIINTASASDGSTALHCAASGGSARSVETVSLLLAHGADLDSSDSHGRKPWDLISELPAAGIIRKKTLESLLKKAEKSREEEEEEEEPFYEPHLVDDDGDGDRPHFPLVDDDGDGDGDDDRPHFPLVDAMASLPARRLSSFQSYSDESAISAKDCGEGSNGGMAIDPSIPDIMTSISSIPDIKMDIKSSLYASDEFRMYSFKIRPCSRSYSHDWTDCPFVHAGENARRRDPRRYHYSCVPCPDFRKASACKRGDACEYAHGVFECWLHPAQYRTRLCKDGPVCSRRVCFFAHESTELRPLYASSLPSPTSSSMDAHTLSPLSPQSARKSQNSLSNYANHGVTSSGGGGARTSSNHLPGLICSYNSSRLRPTLSFRGSDSLDDFGSRMPELDGSDFRTSTLGMSESLLVGHGGLDLDLGVVGDTGSSEMSSRYGSLDLPMTPTNLKDLFSSSSSSSELGFSRQVSMPTPLEQMPMQGPSSHYDSSLAPTLILPHKYSQSQGSRGSLSHKMLGLEEFDVVNVGESRTPNGPLCFTSPMSARASFAQGDKRSHSSRHLVARERSLSSRHLEARERSLSSRHLEARERSLSSRHLEARERSLSSRHLVASSSFSDWGSPTGKAEWSIHKDDLSRFRKSASFGLTGMSSDHRDFRWLAGHHLVENDETITQ